MSKSDGLLSWLQVPTDSELLLATLKMERCAKLAIPCLPSTFPADIATIMGAFSHVPIQLHGALSSPQSACEHKNFAPYWISIADINYPLSAAPGCTAGSPGTSAGSNASDQSRFGADDADGFTCSRESRWPWPKKLSQLLSACSGSLGGCPAFAVHLTAVSCVSTETVQSSCTSA